MNELPTLNAFLNTLCTGLLIAGFIQIRKGNRDNHKRIMLLALTTSLMFLISYVVYHSKVGSVPYPHHDWTRPVYFVILVPHVILAAVMSPLIVTAVWYALHKKYEKHKRLVRWVYPIWIFVSITGVIIYAMLYGRGV